MTSLPSEDPLRRPSDPSGWAPSQRGARGVAPQGPPARRSCSIVYSTPELIKMKLKMRVFVGVSSDETGRRNDEKPVLYGFKGSFILKT